MWLCTATVTMWGCGPVKVENPLSTLEAPHAGARNQGIAMASLDENPTDPAYLKALHRMIWVPGFTTPIREQAFARLRQHDLEGLNRTLRQQLPRMSDQLWDWHNLLCEKIANEGWSDLSPALVSSWARPTGMIDDLERPEYLALSKLHGSDRVVDVVFDLFLQSDRPDAEGLRTRCWELLLRLGEEDRLVALLASSEVKPGDVMLIDLRAAANELGIIPRNREEILWIMKLREPKRAEFWSAATSAVHSLPESQKAQLELRDLAILVSASLHDLDLLGASQQELYGAVEQELRARRHYLHGSNFDGFAGDKPQLLNDYRDQLTWGDLAAIQIAIRAMAVPQVVDHLFRYAEEDRVDTSTEYGGLIALDARGRFEVLEFRPRIRTNDNRFNASQEMFDASYTAVFHFHNHAQHHHNEDYAGPGFGDLNYADNTRANCLVLTFVADDRLNVDYYRHDSVIIDLGEIRRQPE